MTSDEGNPAPFRTPSSPLLPSSWATAVMEAGRGSDPFPGMPLVLLWTTGTAMVIIGCWTARALYLRGYSRSQESRPARLSALPVVDRFLEATTRPFELGLHLGLNLINLGVYEALLHESSKLTLKWNEYIG